MKKTPKHPMPPEKELLTKAVVHHYRRTERTGIATQMSPGHVEGDIVVLTNIHGEVRYRARADKHGHVRFREV